MILRLPLTSLTLYRENPFASLIINPMLTQTNSRFESRVITMNEKGLVSFILSIVSIELYEMIS